MRARGPILLLVVALALLAWAGMHFVEARRDHERAALEREMRESVTSLRQAIARYRAKHGHYPPSLEELVRTRELARLPVDPVTGSDKTWSVTTEEVVRPSSDFTTATAAATATVVVDLRSGAAGADAHGKAWSSY